MLSRTNTQKPITQEDEAEARKAAVLADAVSSLLPIVLRREIEKITGTNNNSNGTDETVFTTTHEP